MASKRKSVNAPVEAAKSVKEIEQTLAQLQTMTREGISNLGQALIEKKEELDELMDELKLRKEELSLTDEAEDLKGQIDELKLLYTDLQAEHGRNVRRLEIEFEDKKAELLRGLEEFKREEGQKMQDAERERSIAQQDQDRARKIQHTEREENLRKLATEIAEKEEALGDFDDKVKAEVAKQTGAIKRELEFKSRHAETESNAKISILNAEISQLRRQNEELQSRVEKAEEIANSAVARSQALSVAAVDSESGKAALEELRAVAHKQAESRK